MTDISKIRVTVHGFEHLSGEPKIVISQVQSFDKDGKYIKAEKLEEIHKHIHKYPVEFKGQEMTEQQLQVLCFTWHWNARPQERGLLYMNHNNPRDAKHGAQLKVMGMVKGVADMTYLSKGGPVFLEFKTEKGKQSPAQKDWQALVENAGYRYCVVRSFEEFVKYLEN